MGSIADFGTDNGTVWGPGKATNPLDSFRGEAALKRQAGARRILFLVDDEAPNRAWFAEAHKDSFCVVTFSSRSALKKALDDQYPVDAVVTDLFFPHSFPKTDAEAVALLDDYEKFETETAYKNVTQEWNAKHRHLWSLDGFDVAADVAERDRNTKRVTPVFLYTLKSPLLLTPQDMQREETFSAHTYWLMEKPNLDSIARLAGSDNRAVARVQRSRILNVLPQRGVRLSLPKTLTLATLLVTPLIATVIYLATLPAALAVTLMGSLLGAIATVAAAFIGRKS